MKSTPKRPARARRVAAPVPASRASTARRKANTPTKALSVMAWVEDPFGNVLLVKQARGRRLWSFPGGKVRPRESLVTALHRELREELGLSIDVATPIDIYDRAPRATVVVLFRVILKPPAAWKVRKKEIEAYAFRRKPPRDATPSLNFFWNRAQVTFDPLAFFRKPSAKN